MIHHLHGKFTEKNPAFVVVECQGVGYFVHISLQTFGKISTADEGTILTHLQITEDKHTLFGFADEDERRIFRLLISVSGIGCNTARMMLSSLTVPELETSIFHEDVRRLMGIKGIGEKTAQRVILELKDKIKKDKPSGPSVHSGLRIKEEATAALVTLGFTRNAVDRTLDLLIKSTPSIGVEELIRQALKAL